MPDRESPILIVDDSPANLKVARVALEGQGFEVRTASDGDEAWRLLAEFDPEVILMDLQMPGLDGFELTRRIKADPQKQHIQIIALTAYAMKGDRERALAAGCDDYVSKPIDPIGLPELVASHLQKRSHVEAPVRTADAILVIEDNPTSRKMMRVALESDGHLVREAGDSHAALQSINEHRPSLIVQDLVLPDMDGLDLVRHIRDSEHGRNVPILCVSGFLARMDDAKALTNGFSALLIKPIDPIQLLEMVRVHLRCSRSDPPPRSMVVVGNDPHVLVVDDDPLQRRLAEFQLRGAGFQVTAVPDAKSALLEIERVVPDAIVSDVSMPDMGGFELCLALRQQPRLARVPIVLISAHYTEPADHELAKQVGATAYLPQSGDWTHALRVIRRALETRTLAPRPVNELQSVHEQILRRALVQVDRQIAANARMSQQCQLLAAQLSVLAGTADALASRTKLEDVLSDVLAVCLDLAGISKGALYLQHEGVLVPRHWIGWSAPEVDGLGSFFGHRAYLEGMIGSGQVTAIPSPHRDGSAVWDLLQRAGTESILVVPVIWSNQIYGALLLGARSLEPSTEPTAFARVLGAQMGQAIGLAESFSRLHSSEARFRVLVDSMEYVTVVDREQRVTAVYGRGFEREHIFPAQRIGKPFQELVGSLEQDAHANAHARALAGESVTYEWCASPGPDARFFQSSLFPILDEQAVVSSIVRLSRDITEQHRLQAQMMVSDRLASVGMLAAGVAHEINNPLMAVLGNLELAIDSLADAPKSADRSAHDLEAALRDAYEAGQRVQAIVRDLRLFSRSEDVRTASVDVHAVLDSTLRMAHNEIRHRAQLKKEYGLVPRISGSDSRLGQVFLNLLVNAAQAIPEGHADENEIRVVTRLDSQERVVVEVHDTGPGISAEVRAKLFTPFITTKPAGIGTGLGLAICRRIVTELHGEITCESGAGRGTVFRVTLMPSHDAPAPEHILPRPSAAARRGRVLVIDDDMALIALIRKALSQDHAVDCSTNAAESLRTLRSGTSYDIILCDVMMPIMSGPEFYEELLRVRPDLATRTVFLTGGAFTTAARTFVDQHTVLCLDKPFDISALRALVNERVA